MEGTTEVWSVKRRLDLNYEENVNLSFIFTTCGDEATRGAAPPSVSPRAIATTGVDRAVVAASVAHWRHKPDRQSRHRRVLMFARHSFHQRRWRGLASQ